jgi:dCMP deaminase
MTNWDQYFLSVCDAISSKSPCLSRQIGAILVRDKSIVSTGYNGPARGFPHCSTKGNTCPRKALGYASGEGLVNCPAAHAEANCIANAARIGASTVGTTLYMNCIIPCKDCMIILVNAGIVEVVVEELTPYHKISAGIAHYGNIKLRRFMI